MRARRPSASATGSTRSAAANPASAASTASSLSSSARSTSTSSVALPGSQRAVEIGPLGDDGQPATGRDRIGGDVDARDARGAGGRQDPRGEDADRRRLAGAVGTEQAEDLT